MLEVDSSLCKWFEQQNWIPLPFQIETWQAVLEEKSGLLQAAPGTGKTYAVFGGFCQKFIQQKESKGGLKLLWITPLRALATDVTASLQEMVEGLQLNWQVGCRTGDTSTAEKTKQSKHLPEILVTTPESLHLLFTRSHYPQLFKDLKGVVIDEWHELLGTKRGVQVELALSHLHRFTDSLQIWGISATIGNIEQALDVLCGHFIPKEKQTIIRSQINKKIQINTLIPKKMTHFPWSGQLGLSLLPDVASLLEISTSSLIFTNTRSQAEIWYRALLELKPEWEAVMGIHHGSLDRQMRKDVENRLQEAQLKVVICTSSLDLGVDFEPVEQVFQIGSPKGIARFLQRAGRSGHQPDQTSVLTFVPMQALELIEIQALKKGISSHDYEMKKPLTLTFDVLVQYLLTLATAEGFEEQPIYEEIKKTYAFQHLTTIQWQWMIHFLEKGGSALQAYDDYKKIIKKDNGYQIASQKQARRHRLSIGTMMSQTALPVRYLKGERLGTIEEGFATRLKADDVFWYNGKCLSFVYLREMTVWVRKAKQQKGVIPRWSGSRLPFSPILAQFLAQAVENLNQQEVVNLETQALTPLIQIQKKWSSIPLHTQILVEKLHSKEGYHLFIYLFEGRMLHEALAQLLAFRLSNKLPITLSMAYNDYGLELLSDQPIPFDPIINQELFAVEHVEKDLLACLKQTELAKHHFREIARVAGLIFTGYPGKQVAHRHLQMSAELLFNVFEKYDSHNYLLKQCYQEVLEFQWNLDHLKQLLQQITEKEWVIKDITQPTPFSFPLFVEQWRDRLSSEQLYDRIEKMTIKLEKAAKKRF